MVNRDTRWRQPEGSMKAEIINLRAENERLREGLANALVGFEETLNLLREHPVLKGHVDKVREIYQRIKISTKALESEG